ncbi:MAG TPA: DedA family protein [Ktedonobacterales bacterium]|nr:DedA family protein [Ktedonobacterales bacterium]
MAQVLNSLASIPALAVYVFVFVWLAAESTGLPLPNEIVLLLAGSLAGRPGHGLSAMLLVIVALVGSLLGASIAYYIGLRGGRAAVLRLGRRFRLDERRLDSVEAWFARSGAVAIFLARITPFVRTVASFPAGMLRFPPRTFLLASLLGSLLWCSVMVGLGNALGANYEVALRLIEQYTLPAIMVVVALIAGYFWLHRRLAHVGAAPLTSEQTKLLEERERH